MKKGSESRPGKALESILDEDSRVKREEMSDHDAPAQHDLEKLV